MRSSILAAAIASAALGGCATFEEFTGAEVPASAEGDFVGAHDGPYLLAEPPQGWWRLYQDPVLDRLVDDAFAANTDLRIAAANLRRVRAALDSTSADQWPSTTLSGNAGYGRQAATTTAPDSTEPLDSEQSYSFGFDVSYEVDLFGRVAQSIAAADADVQAAEAALDLVRVTVAAETARAYADACAANDQIAVAERSTDLQQRTLDLTRGQLIDGATTQLDVARAAAALETTRATIPPLEAVRDSALFRLATLTGRTPSQASAEARACAAVPQIQSPIPVGNGAELLARRPDIREAERALQAAAARVGVATADLYPRITLGGSLSTSALSVGDLVDERALAFQVGPLVSWSFPNMAVARAQLAAAEAGADAALARFDQSVLVALQEVETALSNYASELRRRQILADARDQSAAAVGYARTRFEAGADSFLTVLDADRTLADAEAALAASDAQITAYQIALFKALGGGWSEDQAIAQTDPASTPATGPAIPVVGQPAPAAE